eukprot:jgi/Ulvmu1/5097/UM021_0114.1
MAPQRRVLEQVFRMGGMWASTPCSMLSNTAHLSAVRFNSARTIQQSGIANSCRFRTACVPLACAHMATSSYVKEAVPKHKSFEVKVAARRTGWKAIPAVPKLLGLGGLIPFYALSPPLLKFAGEALAESAMLSPAGAFLLHDLLPYAAMLQIGYGSAIVSFLGAVHWGAAMQSRTGHTTKIMFERYCWSVMPALVVFPAASAGPEMGGSVVISALLLTYLIDAKFNWKGALPKWYLSLRLPLTVGAVGAFAIGMWAGPVEIPEHMSTHGEHFHANDAVVLR